MIAAWMLFALEIGALLFAAAWIAERALLAARRPLRGVWVAAIVGANVLPLVISQLTSTSTLTERWALAVAPQSVLARISAPLLGLWAIAFVTGVFVCLAAVWRMSRTRPSWRSEHVDQTPVLVSHDIGPALVGVMHYSIVVPQWAYSLNQGARRLLLTHEREHARHYDPLLLAAAVFSVVVAPWNLFNWLFLKRLHLAVEMDCDQRVLRAHPDARSYGALLLDVAERVLPSVMPAAAFVEHGASLETRLKAISETRKPFQWLRVSSGLAASLVLVATACVMPRPIIIVVNPPAMVMAPGVPAPTAAVQANAGQTSTSAIATAAVPALGAAGHDSTAAKSPRLAVVGNMAEIRPVAPSARTEALDAAEVARLRAIVLKVEPKTLGAWSRADSALVLLFDSSGVVAKRTAVPRSGRGANSDVYGIFASTFTFPEVNGIDALSEFTIDRGLRGELLEESLKLYTGSVLSGLPIPGTRAEVTPSREVMLATVRARHPETLTDTVDRLQVSALLYDTKGTLLQSATVTMENGPKFPDGSYNNEYERQVWRKSFGVVMDSGAVMQSGTLSFLAGRPLHAGPTKIMYAMLTKRSEFNAFQQLVGDRPRIGSNFGSSSRATGGGYFDAAAMTARLRVLVHTRVPDAYGDWARGDSAVVFLFDADDQLIGRKTGPIPKSTELRPLADYISLRVQSIPADDLDRVGHTSLVASEAGRILDKPLMVVWGRLSAEATRKVRQ